MNGQLNAVVAHEASKRYASMNIKTYACDPGALKTELQRHASPMQQRLGVSDTESVLPHQR
jgi:retinol dehydrogenase 12